MLRAVTGIHCPIRRGYPGGMSPTDSSSVSAEPGRSRFRLPHWGWFLLVTVALVVGFVFLAVWLPWHREQQVVEKLKGLGGRVGTETRGPEWLQQFVGEFRMKEFRVFDRTIHLELDKTAITDADIAHLSRLPNLYFLSLSCTTVTDAGIAHLTRLPNIQYLQLSETAVTDEGLAHLNRLPNLNSLYLSKTAVTDTGLARLSGLTNLQFLFLEDTTVTDSGLAHLSGCKNLGFLFLRGTAVTDTGIADFKRALPDCDIHH